MVLQIKAKSLISILVSKIIINMSKFLFKGGSNFPGRVALKLDRDILKTVAMNYKVILVTGTNGKTTTTSMIYSMLKDSGKSVITNNTGANMLPGIVSCFIDNFSFSKCDSTPYAVIEVDEANLRLFTQHISPEIITITNLFRDQLDRYGEVYTTLRKILQGVETVPMSTLVLNGDESLLGDLGLPNKTIYYGFDCATEIKEIDINADAKFCKVCKKPYKYHYLTYNHLGDFYCESCGYSRPTLDHKITLVKERDTEGSLVAIDGNEYYINQPGTYNIYNGLCAYTIAKECGIENSTIYNSLKSQKSSFGRQEVISIDGKEVKIILVKNPAGYDEAISTISLDAKDFDLAVLLNDNYADGRDVSWIWDVNFEKLKGLNIQKILVSGIRLYDMAIRLKIAGLPQDRLKVIDSLDVLLQEIKAGDTQKIYVLATYTAMMNLRKYLNSKGYIKKLW